MPVHLFGIMLLILTLSSGRLSAMPADSTLFCGTICNSEYKTYIKMDFHHQTVRVEGEDILGDIPGYLGSEDSNRRWYILEAKFKNDNTVELTFVNDDGSEDFKAQLIHSQKDEYELHHLEGSPLKIVIQKKWQKLPKTLVFKKE